MNEIKQNSQINNLLLLSPLFEDIENIGSTESIKNRIRKAQITHDLGDLDKIPEYGKPLDDDED